MTNKLILEPCFGSGEFIYDIHEKFNNCEIVGIEKSDILFRTVANNIGKTHKTTLLCQDFLHTDIGKKFDRIIGNPPYCVVNKNDPHYNYFRNMYPQLSGKFDMYILFLLKSLALLNKNGILKLVVPTSFINVDAYMNVRKFIIENYKILNIIPFATNKWISTHQRSIGVIIQKAPPINNTQFFIQFDKWNIIHNESAIQFLQSFKRNHTISSSGFVVKTGEVVWNYVKDYLTDDTRYPLLIHNSNIKHGYIELKTRKKSSRKNHIRMHDHYIISEPTILVNRGHGNNGNITTTFALIYPDQFKYGAIIENHLYKITDNGKNELEKLFKILLSDKMGLYIRTCCGGGAITKRFIQSLPIIDI